MFLSLRRHMPSVSVIVSLILLLTNWIIVQAEPEPEPDLTLISETDTLIFGDHDFPVIDDAEYELIENLRPKRNAPGGEKYMGNVGYSQCSAPEGLPGTCRPLASCVQYYGTPVHYHYEKADYYSSCIYGYGYRGVCCPDIYFSAQKTSVIHYDPKKYGYTGYYVKPSKEAIIKGCKYAVDYMNKYYRTDKDLGRGEDDASYWGNGIVKDTYQSEIKHHADTGFFISKVTDYLANTYGYNPDVLWDGGELLIDYLQYLPAPYAKVCQSYYKKCYPSKYRTIDGSCNNIKNSFYGQANSILGRIRIPSYSDKIHGVRAGYKGSPLPQVRPIRYQALPDKNIEEKSVNNLYVQYGQFVTHDLVHTPFYQAEDGQFIDCCFGYKGNENQVSPKCYAIPISHDDPFYSKNKEFGHLGVRCLNFARAILGPNYGCGLGYGNPINFQTSFMDLSLQYGRSDNTSHNLRSHKDGCLKMSKVGDQFYLPQDKDAECFNSSMGFCFGSGDFRSTIQPGVTLIQILAARFHNYCAKKLVQYNPYWNDEKLYQEARRLSIAVFQHITYTEYLPILIGWRFMYEYGILPTTHGYSYDYDEYAKPWIYAEFSGAAFRLHSSVYGKIALANEHYQTESEVQMEHHFNSAIIFKNPYNFEKLLRGYIGTAKRKQDEYYDTAISEHLFKDERLFGLDLATFNIQRGRDYGLGSYNDYRELSGLPRASSWSDFHDWVDPKVVDQFKKIYRHPDEVDLYAGGVAEKPYQDSLLGNTWRFIVGYQFQKLKQSDRYFYDLGDMSHSFYLSQLNEIRKMSFASIICLTTNVKKIPAMAFRTISPGNPLVDCSEENIPRLDYGAWKAHPGHQEL